MAIFKDRILLSKCSRFCRTCGNIFWGTTWLVQRGIDGAKWRKCKRESAKTLANPLTGAEAAGFEPANRFRAVNCFRGSLLQPLGHASCYFIGTLSQTIPIPPSPFSRGRSRPAGFPSPLGLPCSPTPARHLMMPRYFIGTLSQTISIPLTPFSRGHIRPSCAPELGAIASLFFGRHLMMPVLIPPTPFSRGQSGPAGFPSPLCLPCPPAPARHLMMPWFPKEFR